MVTLNLPPSLATILPVTEKTPIRGLFEELFVSVVKGDRRRDINKALEETVFEYVAFKTLFMPSIIEEIPKDTGDTERFLQKSNEANWEILANNSQLGLSSADKRVILDGLKGQFDIHRLLNEVQEPNKEYAALAILDGFWAIQGIDLCLTLILFIARGYIEPGSPKTLHWLCLAIKRYLGEFFVATFVNNPELMRRLAAAGKTVSTEEMEDDLE